MRVLLLGARGTVGGAVAAHLEASGVAYTAHPHTAPLDAIAVAGVTHVVNAAGVVPGPSVSAEAYWHGNVRWIERLLPVLAAKHVIHFGTVSVRYRVGAYQTSKLLGEALLMANAPTFASLRVVPLPTLDDAGLVSMLAAKAEAGERPTITRLRYGYCSPAEVGRHVVDDLLLGAGGPLRVEPRWLTEQVRAATSAAFDEGPVQDRWCQDGALSVTNAEAHATFLAAFDA